MASFNEKNNNHYFKEMKNLNKEEYEDVAYYTTLLIDNTIDLMEYPFPQMEVTAKARRSLGVGIVNLANYLASQNAGYTSNKGKRLIHELAEMHSYYMHKASLRRKEVLTKEYLIVATIKKASDTVKAKQRYSLEIPVRFTYVETN